MKKILSILYGIDDRYEIVKNTILVCHQYFDRIQIINSGPSNFEEKLKNIYPKVNVINIENYHGDKEFCWRAHYYGLDDGDWLLWLDSDERTTQIILDNIDKIINECETNNKTNVRFLGYNHYNNNGHIIFDHNLSVDNFMSLFEELSSQFLFDRLIKINKSETHPFSVFGDHGFIMSNKNHHGSWIYKNYPINHYKSDKQFAITCTLTMFFNPLTHYSDLNRINGCLNSEEFKIFENFKKDNNIFTQNQFYKIVVIDKNKEIIDKFKKMCNTPLFKNSKHLFNGMYNWVVNHDLDFEMPKYYCGKECCKYKNIQL